MGKLELKYGRWILKSRGMGKPYLKIGRWILHVKRGNGVL